MNECNPDGRRAVPSVDFLFISGCARTGTTEIVNILNQLPSVAVGMERYKGIANQHRIRDYNPQLYCSNRFFDFREGETNLLPRSPVWREFYGKLEEKFRNRTVQYVGDKLPFMFRMYRQVEDEFPAPKWIMMLRDPVAVAASYDVRARTSDDAWPESHDCRMSVRHWNESVEAIEAMTSELPGRVFVCEYERFYSGDMSYLETLVRFLDLPMSGRLVNHYKSATANWAERVRNRAQLTPDQVEYVKEHGEIEGYERILKEIRS